AAFQDGIPLWYGNLDRAWSGPAWSSYRCCPGRKERESPRLSRGDRKSTRLNSSHRTMSYAVFCLKKKIAGVLLAFRFAIGAVALAAPHFVTADSNVLFSSASSVVRSRLRPTEHPSVCTSPHSVAR